MTEDREMGMPGLDPQAEYGIDYTAEPPAPLAQPDTQFDTSDDDDEEAKPGDPDLEFVTPRERQ